MDPTAALKNALDALVSGNREEVTENLATLLDWLNMGGFLPKAEKLGRNVTTSDGRSTVFHGIGHYYKVGS